MSTNIVFFDTETTGANPAEAKIVELGYVVTDENLEVLNSWRTLVDPEMPIPADAAGVHHITDEDVYNAPTLAQVGPACLAPLQQPGVILVAHNAPFDLQVAASLLPREYESIDTLQLAKRYIPDAPNHKLGTLMYHCKLTVRKNTHSAAEDCMICRDLLLHIMTITGKSVRELITASKEPLLIRIMPFGKHKGLKMEEVPKDYIRWALREMANLDPNMRHTMEKLMRGESLDEEATVCDPV